MDNETLKTILELQKRVVEYEMYLDLMEIMIITGKTNMIAYTDNDSLNKVYQFIYDQFIKEGIEK